MYLSSEVQINNIGSYSKKKTKKRILGTSNRTQDNEQVAKGFYHVRKVKLQSRCVLSANDDDGDDPCVFG